MTKVNIASIVYITTQVFVHVLLLMGLYQPLTEPQVRFALSSASVFTRSDSEFDSVRFYNSLMTFLEDPAEEEQVQDLLLFWNQCVTFLTGH